MRVALEVTLVNELLDHVAVLGVVPLGRFDFVLVVILVLLDKVVTGFLELWGEYVVLRLDVWLLLLFACG